MHRSTHVLLASTVVTTLVSLGVPYSAGAETPDAKATTPTAFAFEGSGYASRIVGDAIPADSDRTAFQVIGCTNRAGLDKVNAEAAVPAGALHLAAAKTRVWTTKSATAASSWARHTVAKVSLSDNAAGHLYLSGVSSLSRAWHDGSGYHATTKTHVASIVLDPATGPDVLFDVPAPGHSVTVPGVATIELGSGKTRAGAGGAAALADALRVHVIATGSDVYVAHSRATIAGPVKSGIFGGSAFGTTVDALDGTATSGETPLSVMPCQGTSGRIQSKSVARSDLGHGIVAHTLRTSERAAEKAGSADAWTRASIATVHLGRGLVVKGVVARAHVVRTSSGTKTDTSGSTAAKVFYRGERVDVSARGTLLRGVASLQPRLVKRTADSIEITALRIKLLGGRALIVNLGHAKARISSSGL